MTISSFFIRASRAFHDHPVAPKLLLLATVSGGGVVAYAESQSDVSSPPIDSNQNEVKKKRVVVLGTGWAGTSFLKHVDASHYDVQVVSPRNYFAFTPLLPSITCGTVEARSIVEPVRNMIKKRNGEIKYYEAECVKIDAANKNVHLRANTDNPLIGTPEFSLEYDYLVVAMGAQVNTFNTPGVKENCHFLKEVEDAQKIRRSIIDCFETAVLPGLSEEEQRRNLHFVIVGGGPTGVEFAAELHDYFQEDLVKLYPMVKDLVKITLIQSGDHILNMFDERISNFAETKFQRDGIDVQTGCRVVSVSDKEIKVKVKSKGEVCSVPHGMVVWATGVGTRPVVRDFMEQVGQANRRVLVTDEWLRVKGCDDVYAIGDCATINQRKIMEDIVAIFAAADKDKSGTLTVAEFRDVVDDIIIRYPQVEHYLQSKHMQDVTDLLKDSKGNDRKEVNIEEFKLALSLVDSQRKSLPATAQVAAQQGTYLSNCFNRRKQCEANPEGPRRFKGSGQHNFLPFRYKHFGQFAPLGGEEAAAELPGDWVSMGHSTQWLWYSVYASKQVSWRTRVLVSISGYVTATPYGSVPGISGGSLAAFHEGRPFHGRTVYAEAAQSEGELKKKVVVLGTGWAGVSFLKNLKSSSYDVEVVSPHNYYLFTPLLPSITCGTVEPRSIVEPIRSINKKGVEDALKIRQSVIDCFERASLPCITEEERKKILHFVVVGGGPAGVEFAAELHDFVTADLAKLYPSVKDDVSITLLEAEHMLIRSTILGIAMDVFAAGSDTSAAVVDWAMSEMIKHPRIMKRAQDEVRELFNRARLVNETSIREMKYLKLVIQESLRLHPPGVLLLPRECAERCVIDGYEIPAKTRVIVNAWAIGRDPNYWSDPETFNPDRFLDSSIDYQGTNFDYIPFDAGRRICPGMLYGLANVELPLAMLLYHFDWKLPNGMKNEDLDMTEEFSVVVDRKQDLHLTPTPYISSSLSYGCKFKNRNKLIKYVYVFFFLVIAIVLCTFVCVLLMSSVILRNYPKLSCKITIKHFALIRAA
ncbi:hypothetical protein ACLB2K_058333 [Fragaria x ananassa]